MKCNSGELLSNTKLTFNIHYMACFSLQILSGLYIGNFRDSKDLKQLDLHKITHILSIHDDARKLFKVQIAKVFWPLKGGLITESFFLAPIS